MQSVRIGIQATQTILYSRNKDGYVPAQIMKLDYFNIASECLFNVFILYYFLSIFNRKPEAPNLDNIVEVDHNTSVESLVVYKENEPVLHEDDKIDKTDSSDIQIGTYEDSPLE